MLVIKIINKYNRDNYFENIYFEFMWPKCCRNAVTQEIKLTRKAPQENKKAKLTSCF